MDKAAAIQRIRQELAEGNIEAALQLLIDNLQPERKSLRDLNNRALQAKAQLEKTQKDELQGVISFENSKLSYNQITQQTINLVDEWEDPSLAPPPLPSPKKKFTPQMTLVAAVLVVFVGIIIWQLLARGEQADSTEEVTHATESCPEFKDDIFSIMVLPYLPLHDPAATDSPHRPLAIRLNRYKRGFSGSFNTEVFSKDQPRPETDQLAVQAAEDCLAKLAIWGEYEHLTPDKNSTIITTSYQYLSSADNFNFTMLDLDSNAEVEETERSSSIPSHGIFIDTVQNYSEIINKAEVTGPLEAQLRLLFGVALVESGTNREEAIELLEEADVQDSSTVLLREMALADAYMHQGEEAKAVEAYDRALKTHPDYWFAVNNRAMLYYQKGEYDVTLEALDEKLEKEPNNITALSLRGSVRLKTMQLKEAEEDLEKAERLSERENDPEQRQYIRKKIEILEEKKATENRRVISANQLLSNEPNNINALTDLAEANRNLGNYPVAKQVATKILDLDGDNIKAIAIKLESADKTRDTRAVTNLRREVKQMDTTRQNLIIQERPIIRAILGNTAIQ
ncbi:tetratricopeptide repeat protein [Flavilitoribacter nigricans]|uniref:Effector-associated domain-containing protein n=1 Tax=Flavilitoribacter nigricans (strain ATCC 23147 / DSM 23189 / NBRC 102662 / NCIMB 1420 / SS-2) TaxID=1122177 RepID=A0A2D0N0C2_FLAN2|nr:tetratricopeptide repeat protein [Flavilitoribacter nigricans]PHN01163.1 hypothetical protein CRP01_38455 [Flavilitoribacter nigricans DSM 23189 = NBRC 102662]